MTNAVRDKMPKCVDVAKAKRNIKPWIIMTNVYHGECLRRHSPWYTRYAIAPVGQSIWRRLEKELQNVRHN